VLVVGDSLHVDIHGGASFGYGTCWFNPTGAENDLGTHPDFEITAIL
jgi:FMN phosphatase YigB (HAD superfamily)